MNILVKASEFLFRNKRRLPMPYWSSSEESLADRSASSHRQTGIESMGCIDKPKTVRGKNVDIKNEIRDVSGIGRSGR